VNERLIGAYMELGAGGAKIYHWGPVFTFMTAISVVLLLAFIALFHDKTSKSEPAEVAVEAA
jgi:hypothetical protein